MINGEYEKTYCLPHTATDRFNRLKLSFLLSLVQEAAGEHSQLLGAGRNDLTQKNLFWAVIRHRVQITRLPSAGETVTVRTWPMPTTRTAYPRSTVVFDRQGQELFRVISLWILMDAGSRAMVLPGKSGVLVPGQLTGTELAAPGSVAPRPFGSTQTRTVRYTDLDINGHMNNCRYADWIWDLLSGAFHGGHIPKELTVCYLSEAVEGETLHLRWELEPSGLLTMDAVRPEELSAGHSRVFAAQVQF